ncbi:zinc-ribbon domain-containing protein [Altericroceibacterium endophyticum]|uniref:Thioredoxin n=1 Tax=Altericroceibacterium endophyticum TaxID=1808508 RepID=A0A6I4T593_9SPHN|nr:zinc-ribbon domain-containing protein [Altericroceibacterium endophyticum]MXO65203.1 thioredoxin [Altericroceibacterium endophyticum]
MIIACPACHTRYAVPDNAISPEGRMVRCAKCRNSWFQDGPETADNMPAGTSGDAAQTEQASAQTAAQEPIPARGDPTASERPAPAPEASTEAPTAPAALTPPPPISHATAESGKRRKRARRNPLKLWSFAAALFAILALATIVAVNFWGLPEWVPVSRPTFAQGHSDLKLEFPADKQDRRQLPNGTEFFGASGTITNTGSESQRVPPILIILRDERDRIVYSWEVLAPKRTLAPGESVAINEAVTDVPRSARVAEIGWNPE